MSFSNQDSVRAITAGESVAAAVRRETSSTVGVENFQFMVGVGLGGVHPGVSSGDSNKELVELGRKQAGQNQSSGKFPSL